MNVSGLSAFSKHTHCWRANLDLNLFPGFSPPSSPPSFMVSELYTTGFSLSVNQKREREKKKRLDVETLIRVRGWGFD